ncbi:MAG TPA: hypothetical protein VL495_08785 [Edaphobacter sp.]|nr:hypothetical protein [Edaphobacter sp.]
MAVPSRAVDNFSRVIPINLTSTKVQIGVPLLPQFTAAGVALVCVPSLLSRRFRAVHKLKRSQNLFRTDRILRQDMICAWMTRTLLRNLWKWWNSAVLLHGGRYVVLACTGQFTISAVGRFSISKINEKKVDANSNALCERKFTQGVCKLMR